MTQELNDINALIKTDTQACAFQTKKSKGFMGFFTPQRKFDAECELKARAKYADQLSAAQNRAYNQEATTFDIFQQEATEGLDPDIIKIIVMALLAVLVIAWLMA